MYDLAIIGGGPAGVAAGVYAARKKLKTIFITKDFEGQSSVSDGIENWIGTVKISGPDLCLSIEKHLRAYAADIVDIKKGELAGTITKSTDGTYAISTITAAGKPAGSYTAKTILVTTGSHRRKLDVPGADTFEHKGVTYCATCDGPVFEGQDVAVIGGGNAAFESAAQLLAYCKSVTLVNRSDSFRADPVTVEKVLAHPNMRVAKNAVPKEVRGDKFASSFVYTDGDKNSPTFGKDVELAVGGIFVEIGSLPTTDYVKNLVKLNAYGNIIVDPRTQRAESLDGSKAGIWAAGDCTDGLYHQNNIAAGDAVKALEDIYIYIKTR
ncbi:MAG: alkyl hydroperoxide reductase subunit alkyl hydroperoxide reductase subunit [Candidatus Taylorbacteria bacterium]|nr:alkyl hydroperoxide reductase subunit alkyl hydroperoxide reductase subunit [Candidatus Taylorbacteria bacterium]